MKRNLAIVPARSGSKRLVNKNILPLCGKPLLSYSIAAAQGAGIYDEIMVSTDSAEYQKVARQYGASVPFLRSSENASDSAGSWDAVKEVMTSYEKLGKEFDSVTLLQPTSPLRTKEDIQGSYQLFMGRAANAVVSVCELDYPIAWCNTLPPDFSMSGFLRTELSADCYYRLNGAIYIVRTNYLMNMEHLYQDQAFAYIMQRQNSVDIDTMADFKYAEAMLTCE